MIYAPMRIFLTGATGYVGGPVLDALVKKGMDRKSVKWEKFW